MNSEAFNTSVVRLEAARLDWTLWRNNRGAHRDETGRLIRYGLANESKAIGDRWKSGDLIGIRPVLITPAMVGVILGQFVSVEVKSDNGPVATAQRDWVHLVTACGGHAIVARKPGDLV